MPQLRADRPGAHVIACGALVRELRAVLPPDCDDLTTTYLPAPLHNRPDQIVASIQAVIDTTPTNDRVFIGYGDCGTGGALDAAIDRWRLEGRSVERLPGDHCYEFFTGTNEFAELHADELGTFFLTDYLARHFDLLIWQGLGLADHPELLPMYFGQYTRVVFLSQSNDPAVLDTLEPLARDAADRLGLTFVHRPTGLDSFGRAVTVALDSPLSGAR